MSRLRPSSHRSRYRPTMMGSCSCPISSASVGPLRAPAPSTPPRSIAVTSALKTPRRRLSAATFWFTAASLLAIRPRSFDGRRPWTVRSTRRALRSSSTPAIHGTLTTTAWNSSGAVHWTATLLRDVPVSFTATTILQPGPRSLPTASPSRRYRRTANSRTAFTKSACWSATLPIA